MCLDDAIIKQYARKMAVLDGGCVYCGSEATTWDHLYPLVVEGMPSGIVPSQLEMVPCCSKCNCAKGRRAWQEHMDRIEPKRNKTEHDARRQFIAEYDKWREENEQRWDVAPHADAIKELATLVHDCHQFLQYVVNNAVRKMHGHNACEFRHAPMVFDWSSVEAQLQHQ